MPDAASAARRAATLDIWTGPVEPRPVTGGITNTNFLVEDGGRRCFVRVGDDIPVHGVMRFNELAASRAAAEIGVSPPVVHAEPGILVLDFIEGQTLEEADLRDPEMLQRVVPLLRRCHEGMARHMSAPALMFWVFHICRHYARLLEDGKSRHRRILPDLMARTDALEATIGPIDLVFGHNDLLPANFIDDGERLWLIDWDYAGFNSPLFDLGGLSSNSQFSQEQSDEMLRLYYDREPDDALRGKLAAMKVASLLRETMWSMVSEIYSEVDFDFGAYTAENMTRLEEAWTALRT
ncbi:choline/ethanolamine kinase family protein [Amorphus orientalis]|uniref:Thiamine kinase-like enzyme n=1 Tax=Amorphus orientalis TaxID=649198 RepID=A0AAE3VKP2_9HYPH|nr:choline/ethanolamine kinase family protein [Amorphus orientalis]MDQ0313777.1 thiamine kinase-like enzyme [Amorphus orientalis]